MRRMYDSVTAAHIPNTATMIAGYVSGHYAWSREDWARFPHATHVRIATQADVDDGVVLDCERGDATPDQCPGWVVRRRRDGVDPTVYCNSSTWPAVRAAFRNARIPEPHYWIARYDGNPSIPAGAVAKQFLWDGHPANSGGHFDVSVVADHWPGVDTAPAAHTPAPSHAPTPAPTPKEEPDMQLTDTWKDEFGNTQEVKTTFERINQMWNDEYTTGAVQASDPTHTKTRLYDLWRDTAKFILAVQNQVSTLEQKIDAIAAKVGA